MNLDKIYEDLSNVDIRNQMIIWDERGKGYYGEYAVFTTLYKNIYGNCKYLMNLNIPTKNNKTTEVDLIMLHETGIYVFEIKHYKGIIYGNSNDKIWTQFFKTTKNSRFNNPIMQNNYHIDALKKIIPNVPIYSVIVFTNNECEIKVKNYESNVLISNLNNLIYSLRSMFNSNNYLYNIDDIDSMFNKLSTYSKIQEKILYNGKEEPLNFWLSQISVDYNKEKNIFNNKLKSINDNYKKKNCLYTIITFITIVISLLIILNINNNYNSLLENEKQNFANLLETEKKNYDDKITLLEQKFKHIDQINNSYITELNQFFSATNVSLKPLGNNSTLFSAKIFNDNNNNTYGMVLTENSTYIVMKNDGKILEYNVFGTHLTYNRSYNIVGKGIRNEGKLAEISFLDVIPDDINYIKLTGIQLIKMNSINTVLKDNLELEIYKK